MDSLHIKRFIVLAVVTLAVVSLAVVGLIMMNDEMAKSLSNARSTMNNDNSSSVQSETTETEETMKVEW